MEPYPELIDPSAHMVEEYWSLFVNQSAYTVMTDNRVDPDCNKYYRPRRSVNSQDFKSLTMDTIRRHLRGEITCMFYAADPLTQSSKWVCVDADYPGAEADLMVLRKRLLDSGLSPLLEDSRRGGHLWLFAKEPLPSSQLRAYLISVVADLGLALFSPDLDFPGLELFPRQDFLEVGRFGNGVRGPLGVHRKNFKRYWFRESPKTFPAQFRLLLESRTLSQFLLDSLTAGLTFSSAPAESLKVIKPVHPRSFFSILDHFTLPHSSSADHKVVCPACFQKHLVITVNGPRKGFYHCFSGCATSEIRAALGQPLFLNRL